MKSIFVIIVPKLLRIDGRDEMNDYFIKCPLVLLLKDISTIFRIFLFSHGIRKKQVTWQGPGHVIRRYEIC